MQVKIVLKPNIRPEEQKEEFLVQELNTGCYQTIGARETQEDALIFQTVPSLSQNPIQIGHLLWSVYKFLDSKLKSEAGTTACTVIYDGKGNLITATVGDTVAFAVLLDADTNTVLHVERLNSKIIKPADETETSRIEKRGVAVSDGRVGGKLAHSREIGGGKFRTYGVCANAKIDIVSIEQLKDKLKVVDRDKKIKIQLVITTDGFTDVVAILQGLKIARFDTPEIKKKHEKLLHARLYCLNTLNKTGLLASESETAKTLAEYALSIGSKDNDSILIHSLTDLNASFLAGGYDGNTGSEAAIYVAENLVHCFQTYSLLSQADYEKDVFSVYKNIADYEIDNSDKISAKHPRVHSSPSLTAGGVRTLFEEVKQQAPDTADERQKPGDENAKTETSIDYVPPASCCSSSATS